MGNGELGKEAGINHKGNMEFHKGSDFSTNIKTIQLLIIVRQAKPTFVGWKIFSL